MLAAGRDEVVSTRNCLDIARRQGIACIVVPGARHELLQERDEIRDQVWAAFDSFVGQLAGAQPAA